MNIDLGRLHLGGAYTAIGAVLNYGTWQRNTDLARLVGP